MRQTHKYLYFKGKDVYSNIAEMMGYEETIMKQYRAYMESLSW